MKEFLVLVRDVLKTGSKVEFGTVAGRVNFFFGILLVLSLLAIFAQSTIVEIRDLVSTVFGRESTGGLWSSLVAFLAVVFYFVVCVLVVAVLEDGEPRS